VIGLNEDAKYIRDLVKRHCQWFAESLPMIASENIISPLAEEILISDLGARYAEGLPKKRYYQGLKFVDEIELKVEAMAKEIFSCRFADVRPISGTVANMAVLYALTSPGDKIVACDIKHGAHISSAVFGAVGLRGLNHIALPFDPKIMNLDVDGSRKVILQEKPKVLLLGMSVFLFPAPVKELSEVAHEVGAKVWYDGAHVLGLIGGGEFQRPLHEGADVMSGSTHKTLPGPQRGIILSDREEDLELRKNLRKAVFPGVTSNHHLNTMAALGITLAEFKAYGKEYVRQIIRNAQALGSAMYELGLDVVAPDLGFTKSHTLVVDVTRQGGGRKVAQDLEDANIIVNKNLLPWDQGTSQEPAGIRLGTQELTRLGMKESEMKHIAELIKRVVIDHEDKEKIKAEVREMRRQFNKVCYCFTEGAPAHIFKEIVRV
jgi:glycine hydroxymethyltransferase